MTHRVQPETAESVEPLDLTSPAGRRRCKFGDPLCPCQDGDSCHYEGPDAWAVPKNLKTGGFMTPAKQPPTYNQPSMEDLANRFTYHTPTPEQTARYRTIRNQAHDLAKNFALLCPDSREKSLALTSLEQAVMWANAAIARNE